MAEAGHRHEIGPDRVDGRIAVEALALNFALGAFLNLVFIGVEVAFGIAANSVALLADAGHNLGDVLGLLVAWGGALLARRLPSERFTYGLGGSSILAALFNAIVLLITVGGIAVAALERLTKPAPVAGITVMAVAAVGILVNGLTAFLFRRSGERDLNVRAVFLHMLADAVVSLAVLFAGIAVALTGKSWIDPALSLFVAALLVASTWRLLRRSLAMALAALARELPARFAINHTTIQVETGDPAHPCELVPDHVV